MIIAQISDTHIDVVGPNGPARRLHVQAHFPVVSAGRAHDCRQCWWGFAASLP
jgi:hypothetical protein